VSLLSDVRVAIRQHLQRPGFALTVIATLAVTIGATTVVSAVVEAMLVRGLPFTRSDRLMWVASVRADNPSAPFTLPEYLDYRARTRSLSGLAALANWSGSVAGDGATERLTGARMSGNAFTVLGATPAAGRLLTESDDSPDAAPVVVLSYRVWQRRFGGSASAIGRSLRINGESFVIAGVLPAQFPMPVQDLDLVTALKPESDPLRHRRNSVNFLRFFGRVADGVTIEQAQAELTTICQTLRDQFPIEYARKQGIAMVPLRDQLVGSHRRTVLTLFGAVVIVLATALANLTSLTLVRAQARSGELTVRAALGASRWQLARTLGAEAAVLVGIATTAGLMLAALTLRVLVLTAPASVPRLGEASIDSLAMLIAGALAAVAAGLLVATPLMTVARVDGANALRSSRGAIGDRWNRRLRDVIVTGEIAAALVLLLATVLLIDHLRSLGRVDAGFVTDHVFAARVALPTSYRSAADVARFYDRLAERLRQSPDVKRFGVISVAPLSGLLATVPFSVEGASVDARERVMANLRTISPGYLDTVTTPVLQGRTFTDDDREGTLDVAMISASLAERVLPDGAVGKRLLINDNNDGPRPVAIVGVIGDVRHIALDQPAGLDIYLPLRQIHRDRVSALVTNQFWMVKTGSDPAAFGRTFVDHLQAVDPDAAVSSPGEMEQTVDAWLAPRRFTLGLFGAFSLTAVALAVFGLYGLVAFVVAQRSREIGVRIAIGASRGDVVRMVLAHAGRVIAFGVSAGAIAAALLRPSVARWFAGIDVNPITVAAAIVMLILTVLSAAALPARRAAHIDPALALRTD
jgi:putative ABC transport system permease protein